MGPNEEPRDTDWALVRELVPSIAVDVAIATATAIAINFKKRNSYEFILHSCPQTLTADEKTRGDMSKEE